MQWCFSLTVVQWAFLILLLHSLISFFLSSCFATGSNDPNFLIGSTLRSLLDGRRIFRISYNSSTFQDPIKDILNHLGYDCTLTFGLAFSSMQMLDQNIQRLLPPGEDDTTSPVCARLRALWSRCNSIHMSPPIPPAQTFPPTPVCYTFTITSQFFIQLARNITSKDKLRWCGSNEAALWEELPRRGPLILIRLHQFDFGHWSINRRSARWSSTSLSNFVSANINTQPWLRLESSKPLRSEIQLLSQLCWDDTPEMDITSVSLFSRLVQQNLNRPQKCLCSLWYVSPTSLQSLRRENCWTHLCPTWSRIRPTPCGSSRILQCRQEDLGCYIEPIFTRFLVLWRVPSRNDSCSIRYFLTPSAETLGSQNNYLHLVIQKAKDTKEKEAAKEKVEKEKRNPSHSTKGTNAPMDSTTTRRSPYAWSIMPESVEEETVALTSMLAQPVFKAEDHVCSNTRRRTTGGSTWLEFDNDTASHLQHTWDCDRPQFTFRTTQDTTSDTNSITFSQTSHHTLRLHQRSLHHLSHWNFSSTRPFRFSRSLNLFLQNQFAYFLTFLLDTQPHFLVLQKPQISIIFLLLTLSSMLLATFLMVNCLKTCWKLHIQDLLEQFGLPHLAVSTQHSEKTMEDPPPLRSKEFLDGFPPLSTLPTTPSPGMKRNHIDDPILFALLCSKKGGFAGKEQPLNSIAWKEPSSRQFVEQCSCYFVATPACKWGLDFFKYWAVAATSDHISHLAGHCSHRDHMDFRGKRLPDGSYISALTAEYPSAFASAIIDIISPWVSKSSLINQDLSTWRSLLSRNPISKGPRITDGAGDISSANWTIPQSTDFFKSLRQMWIKRILATKLHTKVVDACQRHQSDPICFRRPTTSFPQWHPALISINLTGLHNSRSSTVPAFNYFTHYSSSPRTQIQRLPPYTSRRHSLWSFGNQTPAHRQTTLTLLFAMTIGPVPTTILIQHAN